MKRAGQPSASAALSWRTQTRRGSGIKAKLLCGAGRAAPVGLPTGVTRSWRPPLTRSRGVVCSIPVPLAALEVENARHLVQGTARHASWPGYKQQGAQLADSVLRRPGGTHSPPVLKICKPVVLVLLPPLPPLLLRRRGAAWLCRGACGRPHLGVPAVEDVLRDEQVHDALLAPKGRRGGGAPPAGVLHRHLQRADGGARGRGQLRREEQTEVSKASPAAWDPLPALPRTPAAKTEHRGQAASVHNGLLRRGPGCGHGTCPWPVVSSPNSGSDDQAAAQPRQQSASSGAAQAAAERKQQRRSGSSRARAAGREHLVDAQYLGQARLLPAVQHGGYVAEVVGRKLQKGLPLAAGQLLDDVAAGRQGGPGVGEEGAKGQRRRQRSARQRRWLRKQRAAKGGRSAVAASAASVASAARAPTRILIHEQPRHALPNPPLVVRACKVDGRLAAA